MPHARKKNVHEKRLKQLKQPAELINTCVENDDSPRAKPGGPNPSPMEWNPSTIWIQCNKTGKT